MSQGAMICIECRTACAYPSGLPGYQRSLARHLPRIAPNVHFQLLRDRSWFDVPAHPNVHEVVVPGDAQSPLAPALLSRVFDARGVALLHATAGYYPSGIVAPVVTTVHDVLWITDPEWLRPRGIGGRLTAIACRKYVSEALSLSARIIVPSEATFRAIEQRAPNVRERLRLVRHGVEADFAPLEAGDRATQDRVQQVIARLVGAGTRFVLEVGRSALYRNQGGLVRAFASAFASERSIHLVFVQPAGETGRELMRVARRAGVEDRTHVLTGVPVADLADLYRGAMCLCHPTLHEGFATVVAEAMRCGCPVITSGRAGVGEIGEGATQLINPENEDDIAAALRRVGMEPGVADRLRARGLQKARDLSAHRMAEETWQVYQEVLSKRPSILPPAS
jgi:glycosyltransferase involved in cell wall biosynthesis